MDRILMNADGGAGNIPPMPPIPKTSGDLEALIRKVSDSQERAEAALVVLVKKTTEAEALIARLRPWLEELEKRFGKPGEPKAAAKGLMNWLFK